MRQCLFVLGTREQLAAIAPLLDLAQQSGLRHAVWDAGQDRPSAGKRLIWMPKTLYDCFRRVNSAKLWTGKRPLVVVHGNSLSTLLGAIAGSWGGGDIVHLDSGQGSGSLFRPFPEELIRRQIFRQARYAICCNDEAAERMAGYSGCIVVNTMTNSPISGDEASRVAVETLLRWAS